MDTIDRITDEPRDAMIERIAAWCQNWSSEDWMHLSEFAASRGVTMKANIHGDSEARELAYTHADYAIRLHGEFANRCAPETQEVMQ